MSVQYVARSFQWSRSSRIQSVRGSKTRSRTEVALPQSSCIHACPVAPHFASGADALARGARSLEDSCPQEAALLYREAIELYETDGKESQV